VIFIVNKMHSTNHRHIGSYKRKQADKITQWQQVVN